MRKPLAFDRVFFLEISREISNSLFSRLFKNFKSKLSRFLYICKIILQRISLSRESGAI